MKADWTNANPEITAALKKFGRVGVPFYVFYPGGTDNQPITLPGRPDPKHRSRYSDQGAAVTANDSQSGEDKCPLRGSPV